MGAWMQARSSASFEFVFFKPFGLLALARFGRFAIVFVVLAGLLGLAGCSTVRRVDSQVNAFSSLDAMPAALSWRFERLPSQQNLTGTAAQRQKAVEAVVSQQLSKIGFAPQAAEGGAAARWSVQVSARMQRFERSPFDDGWDRPGFGFPGRDYVVTGDGRIIYLPTIPRMEPPWFVREVGLIIRDTVDARVVFETNARHEGRWADDEAVLPAMFEAALQGFPKPPAGQRIVNIDIPR
jgi:hypothetical protein